MTIPTDDKDWTWVLERPCGECGFDSAAHVVAATGNAVRDNATVWRAVLSRPDVAERPNLHTWSALEYACHVRDVFSLYDHRLAQMLNDDDPLFANWNQDDTAVSERYHLQDPELVAEELTEAAHRVADRFDSVSGAAWSRPGRRSDGASFTVESFACYFLHDPVHHLWDVGAASS